MNAVEILEEGLRYIADTPLHSRELDWLEDQIEQALAALRGPEPDWSEAPEWAEWWAVDADGRCYWYPEEPMPALVVWACMPRTQSHYIGVEDLPLGTDWRLTLRQRPRGEQ